MRSAPFTLRPTRWLTPAAAIIMLLLQMVVVVAPLAEGHEGRSMAAHVDGTGPNSHYTHDEATCAACQARTLQGAMALAPRQLPPVAHQEIDSVATRLDAAPTGARLAINCRAPPALT